MQEIILASSSPRRMEILKDLEIAYRVEEPSFDEEDYINKNLKQNDDFCELAKRLSFFKGESVAKSFPNNLVLSADTIVVVQERILGKPNNLHQAYEYLGLLSGKAHKVITGFSLMHINYNYFFSDHELTHVYVKELTEKDINRYLKEEYVMDAAGAYKIQSFFFKYIDKIEGFYHNVMGLPASRVYKAINVFFNKHY